MRRYKHVLAIGGLSLITIGSYFGYTAMIEEPEYVVESVQGKATDDAVKDLHIELTNARVKPTLYDIKLDGTIKVSERNYLTNLYDSIDTNYPKEFYRFIRSTNVSSSEYGTRTYGIEAKTNHINYQSYDEKTKKYTKVRFPYTLKGIHQYEDNESMFQILSQDTDELYVAQNAYGPGKDLKILHFDLKKRQVKEVPFVSPDPKQHQSRTLVSSNVFGTLYLLETGQENKEGDVISRYDYYLDNGKVVKKIKALDEFAYNGSMDLISNNSQLLLYDSPVDQSKDIVWKIYDFKTDKLIEHRVTGKYRNQFNRTQIFNTEERLYQVSPVDKSQFQVTVINLKDDSIEYQGFIKDKNQVKSFDLSNVRIEG
ncbi:hypothetical protein ACV3PA_17210 (plasmid) [Exiguobacterium acetylicum]